MKKYLAIIATLFFSFIIVNEAQAYNFGYTDNYTYNTNGARQTYLRNDNGGVQQTWYGTKQNESTIINATSSNNGGVIDFGKISVYGTSGGSMPAGMFHFSIRWTTPGSREPIKYMGITPINGWTLLNESCFTQVEYETNSQTQQTDLICNYFGYTDGIEQEQDGYINIYFNGNIINVQANIGFIAVISSVDFVRIYDSGSGGGGGYAELETDINHIINRLRDNNNQNTYINLNIVDIKSILETMENEQLTEEKIADVIEQSRQAEQQQYEEQQEDVNDAGTEAQQEASQETSSLTQNVSNIINAIIDQPATNCNIRIQRGAFDTGQLNLCNTAQPIKTMILMIIAIPITLAVLRSAYELMMIYLDKVREEQE